MPNLQFRTYSVRETHVDIDASDLRHLSRDVDVVVVRVGGLTGPNGRPTTRTLRLPVDLFREFDHDLDGFR